MRVYFVVYAYRNSSSINISNSTIKTRKRIKGIKDVESIELHIKNKNNFEEVKLISWKRLYRI